VKGLSEDARERMRVQEEREDEVRDCELLLYGLMPPYAEPQLGNAELWLRKGVAHRRKMDYLEAEDALQQAVGLFDKDRRLAGKGVALRHLGDAALDRNEYKCAEGLLLQAHSALLGAAVTDARLSDVELALGCAYMRLDRSERALACFEEALRIRREVLGGVHADVANAMCHVAFIVEKQGDRERSCSLFRESLHIARLALDAVPVEGLARREADCMVARVAISLAKRVDDDDEKRALWGEAVTILERRVGPHHQHLATALDNLSVAAKDTAERVRLAERAYVIRRQTLVPYHSEVCSSLLNLGNAHYGDGRGDIEQALWYYNEAHDQYKEVAGREQGQALSLQSAAMCLVELGRQHDDKAIKNFERSHQLWVSHAISELPAFVESSPYALTFCAARSSRVGSPQRSWIAPGRASVRQRSSTRERSAASPLFSSR
jgi:tetratricopeptide (TPR) repeat protein